MGAPESKPPASSEPEHDRGAQHSEVVSHAPPSPWHISVVQLPVPVPLFGQYGAIGQQSLFWPQPLPPHMDPVSRVASVPQPVVHPPLHVGPLSPHPPS